MNFRIHMFYWLFLFYILFYLISIVNLIVVIFFILINILLRYYVGFVIDLFEIGVVIVDLLCEDVNVDYVLRSSFVWSRVLVFHMFILLYDFLCFGSVIWLNVFFHDEFFWLGFVVWFNHVVFSRLLNNRGLLFYFWSDCLWLGLLLNLRWLKHIVFVYLWCYKILITC